MIKEGYNSLELKTENVIEISHSIQEEINRVKWTLGRLDWYKENGYNIQNVKFPGEITNAINDGVIPKEIADIKIEESVSSEYVNDEFERQKELILNAWSAIKDNFFRNLETLGLPLQTKYFITLTKYGMGGSYHTPNRVVFSVDRMTEAHYIIAHEIIHLTIESLIQEYKISQWTKELVVDLTMNRFFPERQKIQRKGNNYEKICELFNEHFPDMTTIIKAIYEIK